MAEERGAVFLSAMRLMVSLNEMRCVEMRWGLGLDFWEDIANFGSCIN